MRQPTRRRALPWGGGGGSAVSDGAGSGRVSGSVTSNGSGPAHYSSSAPPAANAASSSTKLNGTASAAPRSGNSLSSLPGRVSVRDNRPPSRRSSSAADGNNGGSMPTLRRKRRAQLKKRRRLVALSKLVGINFYDARHSQAARIIIICLVLIGLGFVGILISVLRSGLGTMTGEEREGDEVVDIGDGKIVSPPHDAAAIYEKHRGKHHHRNHNHHKDRRDEIVPKDEYKGLAEDAAADTSTNDAGGDEEEDDDADIATTNADANAAHNVNAANTQPRKAKAATDDKIEKVAATTFDIEADVANAKAIAEAAADARKEIDAATAKKHPPRGGKQKKTEPRGGSSNNKKAGPGGNTVEKEEDKQKSDNNKKKDGGTTHPHREKPVFKTQLEGAPPCTEVQPSDISYTLVTQLSSDRMWMMGQHCNRWGLDAPISVVVYTDESQDEITNQMVDEGCSRDQLAVQTLSKEGYPETEYPVNVMRNMALSAVKTTHIMYVDVDFWEAIKLREVLEMNSVREEFARDHKLAAVVPAFQIMRQCKEYRDCRDDNLKKMPNTTDQMMDLVKDAQAGAFDPTNRGGHGSTSYGAWYLQKEGEMYDIPCFKSNRYEPYMAFRYCEDLPPFQEQFTGYGKNKLTWVMQMRQMGWDFSQLGQIFLVHYPHLDSKSRLEWNLGPDKIQDPVKLKDGNVRRRTPKDLKDVDWSQYQRGQVDQLYVDFRDWVNNDLPDDARVHPCKDAVDDDSMLWINKE